MSQKVAYVTGGMGGIGTAICQRLHKDGFKVIAGCGPTRDHGKWLAEQKALGYSFYASVGNVGDWDSTVEAFSKSKAEHGTIDVLVNNAGLAKGLSKFFDGDTDHWDQMIDTNLKGLLYVSRTVVPGMIAQGRGHVINIGSIAGKEVYDNGNVYCGTKFAVDAITKRMRLELAVHGLKVTGIHPGAVETEFSVVRFDGDVDRANNVYKGFENLVAEDIAEAIGFVVTRKPHVNINDLVIMPQAQAVAGVIIRKES